MSVLPTAIPRGTTRAETRVPTTLLAPVEDAVQPGTVVGVRRVAVVGNSGSGKTTLGRALAGQLAVPFVELDAIYHQTGWQPLPPEEFARRVEAIVAGEGWVIDGNYSAVRDLVWTRADTVIWFDLPRPTVIRQIVTRTLRRAITRAELWNGNREPITSLFRRDPDRSIIRWAWTQHAKYHRRFTAASSDPTYAHLSFVRIGSRADVHRLLTGHRGPFAPVDHDAEHGPQAG
jgi:adenylate kinase family enzyme